MKVRQVRIKHLVDLMQSLADKLLETEDKEEQIDIRSKLHDLTKQLRKIL